MKEPCKKTNTVYLVTTIVYLAASVALSMLSVRSMTVGVVASLIVGELIVVVPGLCFLLFYRCDLAEWIPFRKVKLSTIGYTILFTATIMPLLYFLNLLSQLIEENVAIDLLAENADIPGVLMLLIVGVFGPVCEEVAFRGVLFGGYRRSGRILAAAIWSGLLFGLFHMNLNQLGYACAIGILSALLLEATNSIWPSIVMHVAINSYNVLQLYISTYLLDKLGMDIQELVKSEEAMSRESIVRMAALMLIPAVAGAAVAIVIFTAIMNNEGSKERVMTALKRRKQKGDMRIITISGILGVIICLFMIFAYEYVVQYIK